MAQMRRIIIVSFCIMMLLLPHVLAFTKSQEFVDASQTKEGSAGRVGVSAGEFSPKEPRFKKFIPPRIIPSITVLTVGFRDILANEPPPIVTPISEFKKQQEAREKEKTTAPEEPQKKQENIRNAALSVKSTSVPDQRASAQTGSVLSLAIILIGLGAYSLTRFTGK